MVLDDNLIPRERDILTWLFINIRAGVVRDEFDPRDASGGQVVVLQKDLISGKEGMEPIPQCSSLGLLDGLIPGQWLRKFEGGQKELYALTPQAEKLGEEALKVPLRLIIHTVRQNEIGNQFSASWGKIHPSGEDVLMILSPDETKGGNLCGPKLITPEVFSALAGSGYLDEFELGASIRGIAGRGKLTSKALQVVAENAKEPTSPPPSQAATAAQNVTSRTEKKAQIFLSYARADTERIEALYHELSNADLTPWMDTKELLPGELWAPKIEAAIEDSTIFLACLSPHSVTKRGYVQRELKAGLDKVQEMLEDDIFLIPVLLEECEVPTLLRKYQWVDLSEPDGVSQLLKAIQTGLERRGVTVPENAPDLGTTAAGPIHEPLQFYSCFLGYSAHDYGFVKRLHADLQDAGIRCWFAPEDIKIGQRIYSQISKAITVHDRLLLVLSDASIESAWVEEEVEIAFERELKAPSPKGEGFAIA